MTSAIVTETRKRRRLKAHFAFSRIPFHKQMPARKMFDSSCQRELLAALLMWLEIGGIALVTGSTGVGKSITVRRFVSELDEARYRVIDFAYLPTTVPGFLRSLCRSLDLPVRGHAADLFDTIKRHLATYAQEHGPHPVIIVDDAEGISVDVADTLRRLTAFELDSADRFSLLISGTEAVMKVLRHPRLDTWRSRVVYAHGLRAFTSEDTRNYIRFHLERATASPKLFTDDAIKRIFQVSHGRPRLINQLATQALVEAAVRGLDDVDGAFIGKVIGAHPLYNL